jgi:hypothetical protein
MYREVSTMVGDHMGIPRTVGFVFYFTPKVKSKTVTPDGQTPPVNCDPMDMDTC